MFPFVGAYGASKHAVEALNDGLRRELRMYGIEVIAIEPGSIRTPIWEKPPERTRAITTRIMRRPGRPA